MLKEKERIYIGELEDMTEREQKNFEGEFKVRQKFYFDNLV